MNDDFIPILGRSAIVHLGEVFTAREYVFADLCDTDGKVYRIQIFAIVKSEVADGNYALGDNYVALPFVIRKGIGVYTVL